MFRPSKVLARSLLSALSERIAPAVDRGQTGRCDASSSQTRQANSIFPLVTGGDPNGGDALGVASPVSAECGRLAIRARYRTLPRDCAALVGQIWSAFRSRYPPSAGEPDEACPAVEIVPRCGMRNGEMFYLWGPVDHHQPVCIPEEYLHQMNHYTAALPQRSPCERLLPGRGY